MSRESDLVFYETKDFKRIQNYMLLAAKNYAQKLAEEDLKLVARCAMISVLHARFWALYDGEVESAVRKWAEW